LKCHIFVDVSAHLSIVWVVSPICVDPPWTYFLARLGLTDIPNVILAPRTEHSRKPEEFFVIANRLGDVLGGSRIELFARQLRQGWDAWGAEVEENSQGAT
jgi:N6-adenosine-specific RNA methylase IME4